MLLGVHKEAEDDDGLHGDGIGEIEIERIPTHVVAVHRKDLVPAIERLQKFTEVHSAGDVMVAEALPEVSGVHEQLLGDEVLQNGFFSGGLGNMQIKCTSSCSTLGSEGVPATMNGFHHANQGVSSQPLIAMFSENECIGQKCEVWTILTSWLVMIYLHSTHKAAEQNFF
jgi:hypothetical protein